jgi:N-acetylneuraminic acid mutarotase
LVLAAGGLGASGSLASAELYNPASGSWTNTGSLNTGRFYDTATLLPNGYVLIAGGEDSGGSTYGTAELFRP